MFEIINDLEVSLHLVLIFEVDGDLGLAHALDVTLILNLKIVLDL